MRTRDRELIAALVEGSLEDESEARALIASSEEARAEYQAQLRAREALTRLGPAQMTEAEKAALHRDLWTRLRSEPAPARRPPSMLPRWAFAAVGLLLVVGVAATLTQGGISSSGNFSLEAAEEGGTLAATAPQAGSAPEDALAAQAAESEETTDLRSSIRTGAAAPDLDLLIRVADQVRRGEYESNALDYDYSGTLKEEWVACLTEAGLTNHEPLGDLQGELRYLIAAPAETQLGPTTPIFFVDANTCTLTYVDE